MAIITSGVYPVFENKFKIGTNGRSSSESEMVTIAEMENFSISIDGNVEEWAAMEDEGWIKRMTTGKGITLSLSGRRHIGDVGNDYIAERAWKTGADCDSKFEWIMPSGAKLDFDCVLSVTEIGGGETRNIAGLAVDVMSYGKPNYTPAASV